MDVVVQDPKRHLRLPTRNARRRCSSRFGRHRRRLSWRIGRTGLSPRSPVSRRAGKIDYLRVAKCFDATVVDILILAIRHQPHSTLRPRQSQIQRCRSSCNNAAGSSTQRPRNPNLLIARHLRQPRRSRRDFRGSLGRRPISVTAPEALRSSSGHPSRSFLYKVSVRVDPGQETAFRVAITNGGLRRDPRHLGIYIAGLALTLSWWVKTRGVECR
jgi:hypothetical protein